MKYNFIKKQIQLDGHKTLLLGIPAGNPLYNVSWDQVHWLKDQKEQLLDFLDSLIQEMEKSSVSIKEELQNVNNEEQDLPAQIGWIEADEHGAQTIHQQLRLAFSTHGLNIIPQFHGINTWDAKPFKLEDLSSEDREKVLLFKKIKTHFKDRVDRFNYYCEKQHNNEPITNWHFVPLMFALGADEDLPDWLAKPFPALDNPKREVHRNRVLYRNYLEAVKIVDTFTENAPQTYVMIDNKPHMVEYSVSKDEFICTDDLTIYYRIEREAGDTPDAEVMYDKIVENLNIFINKFY